MTLTAPAPSVVIDDERRARIDATVDRARRAAEEFRRLDQQQVDAIVAAMVRAGLDPAVELAGLAVEETGFGVFEDKVVKNFVATEFLNDYLKDKKTVGVIDEDPELGIQYVAEPIGVDPGDHPDHQPDLHGAVQGDLRGQDPQRDPVPGRTRWPPGRPCGSSSSWPRPARRPGCRQGRCSSSRPRARGHPLPVQAPADRLPLDDRRSADRRADQLGRQAVPLGRPGQRPLLRPPLAPTSRASSSTS